MSPEAADGSITRLRGDGVFARGVATSPVASSCAGTFKALGRTLPDSLRLRGVLPLLEAEGVPRAEICAEASATTPLATALITLLTGVLTLAADLLQEFEANEPDAETEGVATYALDCALAGGASTFTLRVGCGDPQRSAPATDALAKAANSKLRGTNFFI